MLVPWHSPARGDFPRPLPLCWEPTAEVGAQGLLFCPREPRGAGNHLLGEISPFTASRPRGGLSGGGGREEEEGRGEQSHCLEGTALFEMLFKALDDSQQQLEGISSW